MGHMRHPATLQYCKLQLLVEKVIAIYGKLPLSGVLLCDMPQYGTYAQYRTQDTPEPACKLGTNSVRTLSQDPSLIWAGYETFAGPGLRLEVSSPCH